MEGAGSGGGDDASKNETIVLNLIDSMLKRSLLRGSTSLMFNPGLLRLGKVFVALVLVVPAAPGDSYPG